MDARAGERFLSIEPFVSWIGLKEREPEGVFYDQLQVKHAL